MLKKTMLASACLTIMQPAHSAAQLTGKAHPLFVAAAAGAAAGGFVGGLVASRQTQARTSALATAGASITGVSADQHKNDIEALDKRIQALENAVSAPAPKAARVPTQNRLVHRVDALEKQVPKFATQAGVKEIAQQMEALADIFNLMYTEAQKQDSVFAPLKVPLNKMFSPADRKEPK